MDLNESNQSMTKTVEELGKSFAIKLNVTETSTLTTDESREKRVCVNCTVICQLQRSLFVGQRGKYLARAEAVRDTSASPPPPPTHSSDNEDHQQNLPVMSQVSIIMPISPSN